MERASSCADDGRLVVGRPWLVEFVAAVTISGFFPSCVFRGSTPFFGGEVGVLWWFEWDFFVFPFPQLQ